MLSLKILLNTITYTISSAQLVLIYRGGVLLIIALLLTPLSYSKVRDWHTQEIGYSSEVIGIEGSSDKFLFRYLHHDNKEINNRFQFVGRIFLFPNTDGSHPHYKAGLMVRESIEPSAKNFFLTLSLSDGVILQSRKSSGSTTEIDISGIFKKYKGHIWLKIERFDNKFRTFVSKEGAKWYYLGESLMDFPSKTLIGFASTPHFKNLEIEASFDKFSFKDHFEPTKLQKIERITSFIEPASISASNVSQKSADANKSEIETNKIRYTPQTITIYAGIALISMGLLVAAVALLKFILRPKKKA